MQRQFSLMHLPVCLLLLVAPLAPAQDAPGAASVSLDTVHVAAPTGVIEADRTNTQAAFDAVRPGGTVLFGAGTYLLGSGASLTVPNVTVLGHREGTVLRGCDPEVFDEMEDPEMAATKCTGLYVQTEGQTIQGLTFEYVWHGIVIGAYPTTEEEFRAIMESEKLPSPLLAGGQRIEGNTFRASPNGLRVTGTEGAVSVVRDNDFIDVYHAIGFDGAPLHFINNRITVDEPRRIPNSHHQGSAVGILASPTHGCSGHIVAENTIDGYHDGISIVVFRGEVCRDVEILDNTIAVRRVAAPRTWRGVDPTGADTTIVGVPISLHNFTQFIPMPGASEDDLEGVLEDILILGNRIAGAEGIGIKVSHASQIRIVGNTITGIQRRVPFPGNTWGFPPMWATANGSAIWISPGSEGNEIAENVFEDIEGDAVVLEGDQNQVVVLDSNDTVRDLGSGNVVTQRSEGH